MHMATCFQHMITFGQGQHTTMKNKSSELVNTQQSTTKNYHTNIWQLQMTTSVTQQPAYTTHRPIATVL